MSNYKIKDEDIFTCHNLSKTAFVYRVWVIVLIIFLVATTKYTMYIKFVIYLCCIHGYKRKRLQYEVVSNLTQMEVQ